MNGEVIVIKIVVCSKVGTFFAALCENLVEFLEENVGFSKTIALRSLILLLIHTQPPDIYQSYLKVPILLPSTLVSGELTLLVIFL